MDRRGWQIYGPSRHPGQARAAGSRCTDQSGGFADFGSSSQMEPSVRHDRRRAGSWGPVSAAQSGHDSVYPPCPPVCCCPPLRTSVLSSAWSLERRIRLLVLWLQDQSSLVLQTGLDSQLLPENRKLLIDFEIYLFSFVWNTENNFCKAIFAMLLYNIR